MTWIIVSIVSFCFLMLGFAVGYHFAIRKTINESIGTLRVDHSDPDDNPYLFLELTSGLNISNRDYVTLKVNVQNYISQK